MSAQQIEEAPVLSAGRRENIEHELDKLGLTWRFNADGHVDDIDERKSLANQARLGTAIVDERVETYAEAIKNGAKMPALVVDYTGRKRKGIIMDGNHRMLGSKRAGYDIFARYEVTAGDPSAITLYTFRANVEHGLPNSIEDRIEHAIWLIESGVTRSHALRQLQVPIKEFNRAWARHQADQRADEVGLDRVTWDSLGASVRARLLNVNTDDAFKAASELSHRAGLGAEEVFDIVGQLNGSKSWTKQRAIIEAHEAVYADRIAAGGGGALSRGTRSRKALTPKQRWNMAVGFVVGLPEPDAVAKLVVGAERDAYKKRVKEAADKLMALHRAL